MRRRRCGSLTRVKDALHAGDSKPRRMVSGDVLGFADVVDHGLHFGAGRIDHRLRTARTTISVEKV